VKLIVCCWNLAQGKQQTEDLKKQMAADAVFASLQACTEQIDAWICRPPSHGGTRPVLPDAKPEQVAALHSLGLAAAKSQQFHEASRKVAQAFNVPIALVSLAEDIHPAQPDPTDLSQENQATQEAPHEEPLGAYVIAANEALVSEDVTEDPRFADDPRVLEKGIRFYAGVPLRTSAGHVVGSLCIVDTQPREFADRDRLRLQKMADELMDQIEGRATQAAVPPSDSIGSAPSTS
jgi:GAF domain-containing protein